MSIYIAPRSRAINVWQNQTISYEFRVVEHLNDEGKVTKYVMQTQIWAHEPPNDNGVSSPPNLVSDWKDVPRVQMRDGLIVSPASMGSAITSMPPSGKSGQVLTRDPNDKLVWVDPMISIATSPKE